MKSVMYMLPILLLQTKFETQKEWLLTSDKVYSLLTVLLIIFVAMIAYLVWTNRKVNRLEEKMDSLENK